MQYCATVRLAILNAHGESAAPNECCRYCLQNDAVDPIDALSAQSYGQID